MRLEWPIIIESWNGLLLRLEWPIIVEGWNGLILLFKAGMAFIVDGSYI